MIRFASALLAAVPEKAFQYFLTEVAIARYQTMVTKLIVNKNRLSYKQTTKHLQRIRSLYEGIEM